MSHYLYIIYDTYGNTYNGYTTDLVRRLRQHNKEIKGGAKYTTSRVKGPKHWKYLITLTSSDFTLHNALSLEWSIKYPTNRRPRPSHFSGPNGRLDSLPLVFRNPKFEDMTFEVTMHAEEYRAKVLTLLSGFTNVSVSSVVFQ